MLICWCSLKVVLVNVLVYGWCLLKVVYVRYIKAHKLGACYVITKATLSAGLLLSLDVFHLWYLLPLCISKDCVQCHELLRIPTYPYVSLVHRKPSEHLNLCDPARDWCLVMTSVQDTKHRKVIFSAVLITMFSSQIMSQLLYFVMTRKLTNHPQTVLWIWYGCCKYITSPA